MGKNRGRKGNSCGSGFEGWWTKAKGRRPAELLRTPLAKPSERKLQQRKRDGWKETARGNGVPVQIAGEIAPGVTARRSSDFAVTIGNQDRLSSNFGLSQLKLSQIRFCQTNKSNKIAYDKHSDRLI